MNENGAITRATLVAHQAALDEHFRIKSDLAKFGVCAGDFDLMQRYALADFNAAVERNREA